MASTDKDTVNPPADAWRGSVRRVGDDDGFFGLCNRLLAAQYQFAREPRAEVVPGTAGFGVGPAQDGG
jgi:hypothetical protein